MEDRKRRRFRIRHNSWGAQAERKVQQILEQLPMDHFIVMNDVRFRYGNIDHLVIRNDGIVFMIDTKSEHGSITFDGRKLLVNRRPFRRDPICQMNRNIRWIREFIREAWGANQWFISVVVFANARLCLKSPVGKVSILTAEELTAFLSR